MSARDDILARLGGMTPAGTIAAEADALLIAPERPAVDTMRLDAAFADRLAQPALAATLDRIATLADLPRAVAAYLTSQSLPRALFLQPDPRLATADWSDFMLHDSAAHEETVVLAIARCGVAETGSLVFETGPASPMLPNFVALHHIVVVPAVVGWLEDAVLSGPQPRAHYWVMGVSGTTDIEGTYVRGAHGPRFLHVIRLG